MFEITNYSEGQEDFFIVKIGQTETVILIDGGKNIKTCKNVFDHVDITKIDYIVLTHIDNDHICGVLHLLNMYTEKCKDSVIVYNKFVDGVISYKQAEQFEKIIKNHEVIVSYKEYQQNNGVIKFLSVDQRKKTKLIKNRIYLTFLSPDQTKVENLYKAYCYQKDHHKKMSRDEIIVNDSSIMFLLEYGEQAILMTGDGYIQNVIEPIRQLCDKEITYSTLKDLFLIKIPHHGSKANNIGLEELLRYTPCTRFILTNSKTGSVQVEEELEKIIAGKKVCSSSDEPSIILLKE